MGIDLNSNRHLDPQMQEFIKYFDRMESEATEKDYRNMLRDIRDECTIRLKRLKQGKNNSSL